VLIRCITTCSADIMFHQLSACDVHGVKNETEIFRLILRHPVDSFATVSCSLLYKLLPNFVIVHGLLIPVVQSIRL